jgi:Na+/alanine symporter
MNWLFNNWQILFGGIAGTAVVALIGWGLKRLFDSNKEPSGQLTAQGATVSDSPVASGTGNSQRVNSPTNIFMGLAYLQLLPRNALSRLNWSETWRNNHPVGFDRNVQGYLLPTASPSEYIRKTLYT